MTARTPRAISNDAFHQIKADYPERSFAKALLEGRITERDITLIRSFIAEMQSSRNTHLVKSPPKALESRPFLPPYPIQTPVRLPEREYEGRFFRWWLKKWQLEGSQISYHLLSCGSVDPLQFYQGKVAGHAK